MAAPVPPGAPRQQSPPPPNYNPTLQQNPNSLSDNFQNLNINRPVSMPNSAPRPAPFAQSPPFPSTAPSPPMSRPGPPPPGMVPRPTGAPQPTLAPTMASGRPTGPPMGQPTPFGSRPPPGSLPSSMGSAGPVGVLPPGVRPPGAFPSSGSLTGPVGPPPGVRPGPFAPSPSVGSGLSAPPSNASNGLSNGPSAFHAPGAPPLGGQRFPMTGIGMQTQPPPVGPQSLMTSARPLSQPPSMQAPLGGPTAGSSLVTQGQPPMLLSSASPVATPFSGAPPFSSALPHGVPPPHGLPPPPSPFGSQQTWPPQQVTL